MKRFVYPWPHTDAVTCFTAVADQPYSLFFDSARTSHPLNRHSFICWQPFETIESKDGVITITNADQQLSFEADAFEAVRERMQVWFANGAADEQSNLPPFTGGAAGFWGYDLARQIEKLPSITPNNKDMPDMAVGLYAQVLAFDHEADQAWLILHAQDEREAEIRKSYIEKPAAQNGGVLQQPPCPALDWQTEKNESAYQQDVRRVIDYIRAGDIFQANLSRRFAATLPQHFHPFAHYCVLREINAAPYAGYFNFGDIKIASASPERFLSVRNGHVETRPIKGTAPADKSPNTLSGSEKDRAENAMIVDLLRNDLSKVCDDHSISVPELCAVESFENVHHLVSTVRGTLREDQTPLDLLKACFPGGSITGAPKVRAMEIIEELEPQRRGPYCGCAGYIGFDGSMDSSILIRSLVYQGNTVSLQTGGGITALSDPVAELQETKDKAAKLFESFETQDARSKKRA